MSSRLNNFSKLAKQHPYHGIRGKLRLAQYLILRFLPISWSFPKMSIISFCKSYYKLNSNEEFRSRYYFSRIGFQDIWVSRNRKTKKEIEDFYVEHDKDILRQAYLSKYDYIYKKKILNVYHMAEESICDKNLPVLDYGCGAGVFAHYLHSKGFKNVSVADIESQTLNFVSHTMKNLFKNISAVNGSKQVDLPKNHYQIITVLDVLEHTIDPLEITKKLIDSLSSGGVLIINFPIETDFSSAHTFEAQQQRGSVFNLLSEQCDVLEKETVYRKK